MVSLSPVVTVPNMAVGGSTLYSVILKEVDPFKLIVFPFSFNVMVRGMVFFTPFIVKLPLVAISYIPLPLEVDLTTSVNSKEIFLWLVVFKAL